MARDKKLPAGIYMKGDKYACRPYDRVAKKKSPERVFDSLAQAVQYKEDFAKRHVAPTHLTLTVAQFAEEWMTDPGFQRPKQSTNIHHHERVRTFVEEFGDKPMIEITRSIARKWSQNNPSRYGSVRTMFSDAIGDDRIPGPNPFYRLRIGKGQGRKHQDPPTENEVRALAQIAYDQWPDWQFFGSYILFAAYTGVRLGELLAIRWSDINWEQATVHIGRQWNTKIRDYDTVKNDRPRDIVLFEPAAEALRILPKDGPDGLVWRSPNGKRIEPNLHFYYWNQVRQRFFGTLSQDRFEALQEMDFHTLRHFHASWEVDMGIPPADVAAQLGHTDGGILVQKLYGHLYPDNSLARRRAAYEQSRLAS